MSKHFCPQIITLPSALEPRTRSGAPFQPPEVYLAELEKLLDRKEEHLNKISEVSTVLDSLGKTVQCTLEDGLAELVQQIAETLQKPPELYPEHVNSEELMKVLNRNGPFAFEVTQVSKLKPKLYRRRQFECLPIRIIAKVRALANEAIPPELDFEVEVYSTVHPIKRLEENSKQTPLLLYQSGKSDEQGMIEFKRLTFTEDTCAFPYEKVHLVLTCTSRIDVHPLVLEDIHVSTPRKKY